MRQIIMRHSTTVFAALCITLWSMTPGYAQQSEIQQLRELIQQQQAQIEALSNKLEAIAISTEQTQNTVKQVQAASADTANSHAAPPAKKGEKTPGIVLTENEKVSLTIGGQVNRALLMVDDGEKQDIYNVDNDMSSTRVKFVAVAKLNKDWTAGTNIEVDIRSNTSSAVNQFSEAGVGGTLGERILEVTFEGPIGKFSLGQGNNASTNTSEFDLSGTTVASYSNIKEFAGGMAFVNSATGLFCTDSNGNGLCTPAGALDPLNPTIGATFFNLDGISRDDRIRYDTPKFMNFVASTSLAAGSASDVALSYTAEISSFKIAAGVAYANFSSNTNSASHTGPLQDQINGSVSVLHGSGANLTFAAGAAEGNTPTGTAAASQVDPNFYYVKAGWLFGDLLMPHSKTAFSIDYNNSDEGIVVSDEAEMIGFAVVHTLSDYGTDFYAAYRHFELERIGVNFDDMDVIMTGARIKF